MQFFTLAALFGAAAMAAPAPQTPECPNPAHCGGPPDPSTYENIDISDYTLRKNNGTIQSVSFKLSGNNATDLECSGGPYPVLGGEVDTCGDSKYRFAMTPAENGTDAFGIRIYHELGLAWGFWGEGVVPSYCRAGGNGINDFICQQVSEYTLVISFSG
nr:Alt a 1 domain-containing protein [Alternaria solani]WPZ50801.1 Alt a 1 domain-containing protein [Alternaria solani]WPZ50802.1 Alt a 1 domain-containing protein [Alternaria solani]WPZ50803.1 Alt a 1 domain-containing protein [Alternaria solani]WPZ50804.1 Alt a 1 domain-containing protein [Alternaria solani]